MYLGKFILPEKTFIAFMNSESVAIAGFYRLPLSIFYDVTGQRMQLRSLPDPILLIAQTSQAILWKCACIVDWSLERPLSLMQGSTLLASLTCKRWDEGAGRTVVLLLSCKRVQRILYSSCCHTQSCTTVACTYQPNIGLHSSSTQFLFSLECL